MTSTEITTAYINHLNGLVGSKQKFESGRTAMAFAYVVVGLFAMLGSFLSLFLGIFLLCMAAHIAGSTTNRAQTKEGLRYSPEILNSPAFKSINTACENISQAILVTSRTNCVDIHINSSIPYLDFGIPIYEFTDHKKSLYFLPDMLLVWENKIYSAVPYDRLRVECLGRAQADGQFDALTPDEWKESSGLTFYDRDKKFFFFLASSDYRAEKFSAAFTQSAPST